MITTNEGKIKREEFFEVMQKILPGSSYVELDQLFERLDIKKSGAIDYEELLHSAAGENFLKNILGLEDDNSSVKALSPRKHVNLNSFQTGSGNKPHTHVHNRNNSNGSFVVKGGNLPTHTKKRDSMESIGSSIAEAESDQGGPWRRSQRTMLVHSDTHHPKDLDTIHQMKLQLQNLREDNKKAKPLEKELRELRSAMDVMKSDNQRLELQYDDVKKELEAVQSERSELQQQNEKLELHCKQMENRMESAVVQPTTNEEDRLDQIQKLETTILELRKDTDTLSEQEQSMHRTSSTQRDRIQTLELQNTQLQQQLSTMANRLSEQSDTSEGLQFELLRTQDFLHKRMKSAIHLKQEVIQLLKRLGFFFFLFFFFFFFFNKQIFKYVYEPSPKNKQENNIQFRVKRLSRNMSLEAIKLANEATVQFDLFFFHPPLLQQ
ncbi:coiled-coil domain containing protein [Reticulomyxa filosa]|uniref:Coiled-coil domain containing protein n=1 Tax=Reticulomyxa filosa TaxID=46433 RepID=X6N846_RETFI|nr:coiled-coil domain containing protein [Reticulomyxa filosa]|eukprot:ETO21472.1 coiled-coil domain containing protein [Reticulomyxa filosa]